MPSQSPTEAAIRELGEELHLDLTEEEIADYREMVADSLEMYEEIGASEHAPSDRSSARDRDTGYRVRDGDPYNAWITRCEVRETEGGPLADMDVGLKDSISFGGVEMTCGSNVLEGYVPDNDAPLVSRLLNAGATIVGKTNMDDMALTGAGFSSAFGATLNPQNDEYLAGGSSGGSAIAVATGDADLTIGTDQGGSIRVPASWSGVVGHKPTYGLVPYTGIVGLENTIDHAGPMAQDVRTCARALSVISGQSPGDPRQPERVPEVDYEAALDGDVDDLSIAVIEEGFHQPESDQAVNERVTAAIELLDDLGATTERISLPIHDESWVYNAVTIAEALLATVRGEGMGHGWKGKYDTSLMKAFGKSRRDKGGTFPPSVKLTLLQGAYASKHLHSEYYGEAMNLRMELTRSYEAVFAEYDLVAMPAAPGTAKKHRPDQDRFEFIDRAWGSLSNTAAFNMTGHPSVSVPVKEVDGLPVGLMLSGGKFEDADVLNAAYAVEQNLPET